MASPETPADSRAAVPTVLVLVGAVVAILCTGLVFVLGRQQEWTVGGTYLRLFAAALIINLACLLRWNPELIWRRAFPGKAGRPGTSCGPC